MSEATGKKAVLHLDGKEIELPIYSGTLGPDVIDVKDVLASGHFTFDPGFMATASCESKITFIDGDKGILLHRGYPIDQLATQADYLETCYLLLNGELPTAEQKLSSMRKFVLTLWFTIKLAVSSMVSVVTHTLWQSWLV